jgi:hypothetical protein
MDRFALRTAKQPANAEAALAFGMLPITQPGEAQGRRIPVVKTENRARPREATPKTL